MSIPFSKLLSSSLIMKLILTCHISSQCDTHLIYNRRAFWAEPLIPLSPAFAAFTPFSAAPWTEHRIWFFTHHQSCTASLRRRITPSSQWKRDVILGDYLGCLFCSGLSCLLKIDRPCCFKISNCITKSTELQTM